MQLNNFTFSSSYFCIVALVYLPPSTFNIYNDDDSQIVMLLSLKISF